VFRQDIPFERRPAHSIIMPLRAAPYKGSDMGIRVVESITDRIPDVSLTLFGNRHALRGIRPRPPKWVRTLHNPTNLELARAYNQSRIFLFPSRLEGFPVTPLEAMLCGCLVVSTPNSGVAPYLANGSTGFLSETFEIDSLASTLVSSFAQLDSSQAVVARGAATAGTYSWENSLRMFLQALT
jgi:glycosyltransferase involved in cell wall biosynthesis